MKKKKPVSTIVALALIGGLGIFAGCGGGDGGGAPATTTLQHPLFPSTVGDTWTYEWFDRVTYLPTGAITTETVTSVSGNSLTITDDTGDERYYELREDPVGRVYVVMTGRPGVTFTPPVVIIPPDLTAGVLYNGGGYTFTIAGIGQWTCTAHTLLPNPRRIVVEAGTFDPAQEIYMTEAWLVPGGGTGWVDGFNWYAPGVGLVKQELWMYNPSTGITSPGWWIHLKSYTVH